MAQFNASTNSLYADALYWSGATTDTFPIDPDFTRLANFALDFLAAIAMKFDASWEWQDSNDSANELIDGTTTLTSGTSKYTPSVGWLKISRVRIKDPNGNWITLEPVDRRQLSDSQLSASGTPSGYYKLGAHIYLVGTPNYTQANGIEVQVQKGKVDFVVADTTAVPGIPSPFHRLVSLMPALDFCEVNEMEQRASALRKRIGSVPDPQLNDSGSGMLREFAIFMSERDKDLAPAMTLRREDYGAGAMMDDFDQNPRGF